METLTDDGLRERVEAALESVRPGILADGGDVWLISIEDRVAYVQMVGACGGCAMSTATLKFAIEAIGPRRLPRNRPGRTDLASPPTLPAAADFQIVPATYDAFRRQQPQNRFGDFVRGAGATDRDAAGEPLEPSRIAGRGVNLRLDQTGRNGVDADAFTGDFAREADRKRVDARLWRPRSGRIRPGLPRRDASDEMLTIAPPEPPWRFGHAANRFARAQDRAGDV